MDITQLLPWVVGASTVLSIVTALYTLLTSGAKGTAVALTAFQIDTEARFDQLENERNLRGEAITARFNLVEMQLAKIDVSLKHLPDLEQSHRLEIALQTLIGRIETIDATFSGRMAAMDERLKPVSAISDRLQEFLLDQAKQR